MKRASYRDAVDWIAQNDNSGNGDNEYEIAGYVSTVLIADIFGVSSEKVAKDIVRLRRKLGLTVGEEKEEWFS